MIPLGREDKVQLDPKLKMEKDKIVFKGSHPDNLYRVVSGGGAGAGKFARALRILRWPAALVLVCVALAVFVYFLMPDTIDSELGRGNATYWETVSAGAGAHFRKSPPGPETKSEKVKEKGTTPQPAQGTRTSEIDFYDADDLTSIIDTVTETSTNRKLPIQPVYPSHITPEVQYGNEKADSDKLRTAKILEETNSLPEDSTLKPHITQKPEKPLEIYFKDGNGITTTTLSTPETITNAETIHDYSNYGEKYTTKQVEESRKKTLVHSSAYREQSAHLPINQASPTNTIPAKQLETPIPVPVYAKEPEVPPEIQEFYQRRPTHVDVNFTSGHSKLFGISIEDAEKMRSTTQSSVYNTRVSPTLPTWRDGDDSTTKHYPVNVNYDVNGLPIVRDASGIMPYAYGYFDIVPQCRSTRLAVCRGVLPYDLAGPGAKINGVDMTVMMPQIEYLIATNCSERLQPFLCALLEPECNPPPYPAKMPCYNLCKAISDNCEGLIPVPLLPVFNCNQYSTANCVSAKTPCNSREMTCGDGSCVPRDWICDGAQDCPAGEDEAKCVVCEPTEFKCQSGGCILKRWMCDGYADCPEGEDEAEGVCEKNSNATNVRRNEPGEESAGSAPAPAVRKPYKVPNAKKNKEFTGRGENESSKELLVTSDSKSALMMRNIAARPSLSRLTPYSRPSLSDSRPKEDPTLEAQPLPKEEIKPKPEFRPKVAAVETDSKKKNQNNGDNKEQNPKTESEEEGRAIGDLGFFDEMDKEESVDRERKEEKKETLPYEAPQSQLAYAAPPSDYAAPPSDPLTRLDKSLNKLEKVIDGASLLRKAASQQDPPDSPEKTADKEEMPVSQAQQSNLASWASAHASPCPSGELRCVDGRCITLAQLCDGTIDCSDHADEDNCYT